MISRNLRGILGVNRNLVVEYGIEELAMHAECETGSRIVGYQLGVRY